MGRHCFVLLLLALLLTAPALPAGAQQPPTPGRSLTVEEVVKLAQGGFADDLIITKIRKNGKAFDLSTDELIELKKAGVSDQVVKYLLDPSLPYTEPPPPAAPAAAVAEPEKASAPGKVYPPDALAGSVPAAPGLYLFRNDSPIKIDIKLMLGANEGAGLGKILMKKGKATAFLPGPASKTRVTDGHPVFYLRLPEGKAIEEVLLVALDQKRDRREVEIGAPGPKQEFKPEVIRPIEPLEVGLHLFRITPVKLIPGEYMFVLLGSAEPQKGTQGKAYDFGIDPEKPAKPAKK